jgi:hypothetical protein
MRVFARAIKLTAGLTPVVTANLMRQTTPGGPRGVEALVDAAMPPSVRGRVRACKIWIDDALGGAARRRLGALRQRGIAAFDAAAAQAVDLQANWIVRIVRLGPSRCRRQNRRDRQNRQSRNPHRSLHPKSSVPAQGRISSRIFRSQANRPLCPGQFTFARWRALKDRELGSVGPERPGKSRSAQLFNLPSTMFGYPRCMGTRLDDSKKTPVRALQRRHALLAAYLNIVDRLDGPSRRHAGEFRQHRPRRDIATCRVRSLSRMAGRMGGPFPAGRGPFQAG